jgi:hypothetical protein
MFLEREERCLQIKESYLVNRKDIVKNIAFPILDVYLF